MNKVSVAFPAGIIRFLFFPLLKMFHFHKEDGLAISFWSPKKPQTVLVLMKKLMVEGGDEQSSFTVSRIQTRKLWENFVEEMFSLCKSESVVASSKSHSLSISVQYRIYIPRGSSRWCGVGGKEEGKGMITS